MVLFYNDNGNLMPHQPDNSNRTIKKNRKCNKNPMFSDLEDVIVKAKMVINQIHGSKGDSNKEMLVKNLAIQNTLLQ